MSDEQIAGLQIQDSPSSGSSEDTNPFLAAGLLHAGALKANPRFPIAAKALAQSLLDAFAARPIPIRFAGAGARFLTVAAFFCLHHVRDPDDDQSGATLSRIIDRIQHLGQVSRNTIASQVSELHTYGWIDHVQPASDRRLRLLVPTLEMQVEFEKWMFSFLGALDTLDGGARTATAATRPDLMIEIARLGMDVLLGPSPWTAPPEEIGALYWRDGGYLVLLSLVASANPAPTEIGGQWRHAMPDFDVDAIAAKAFVSARHVRAITGAARQHKHLDLGGTRRNTYASMSTDYYTLLTDWLALKLALFDLVTMMAMGGLNRR